MLEKENKRLKENEIENERGRSMVEMLGVLAIMGVLAIGGIAGYRYAMDKYNANEILNEVRKRAVTASQQRLLGHSINLSEYGVNTVQGYAIETADNYNGNATQFTITVKGINQGVCNQVIDSPLPMVIEELVGGVVVAEDVDCTAETNDVLFAFANDLASGSVGGGDDGDGGEGNENERVDYLKYCCPQSTSCTTICAADEECRWGVCEKPEDYGCPEDKPFKTKNPYLTQGCFSCDDPSWTSGDIYACRSICDGRDNTAHKKRYVYYADDYNGACVLTCPQGTTVDESRQLCVREFSSDPCSGYFGAYDFSDAEDRCSLCGGKFVPMYNYTMSGFCCLDAGDRFWHSGLCEACDGIWDINEQKCSGIPVLSQPESSVSGGYQPEQTGSGNGGQEVTTSGVYQPEQTVSGYY